MSSSSLVIIVSYEGREGSFRINVGPSLELADEEIERASEELWESIRASFRLSPETRIALHEAETGRIMSKETLRDPSCIPSFPKYWYLTVDNGYTRPATTNKNNSLTTALSGEEENVSYFHCVCVCVLLNIYIFHPINVWRDNDGHLLITTLLALIDTLVIRLSDKNLDFYFQIAIALFVSKAKCDITSSAFCILC